MNERVDAIVNQMKNAANDAVWNIGDVRHVVQDLVRVIDRQRDVIEAVRFIDVDAGNVYVDGCTNEDPHIDRDCLNKIRAALRALGGRSGG